MNFDSGCQPPTVQGLQTVIEQFEGSYRKFQQQQQRFQEERRKHADQTVRHAAAAAGGVLGNIMTAWEGGQEAGPPPAWINKVHASHSDDLWFLAGMVYCNICGCLSSSFPSNSKLFRPCKRFTAKGSLPRLARLRKGLHPEGASTWPDGRSVNEPVRAKQLAPYKAPGKGSNMAFFVPQQVDFEGRAALEAELSEEVTEDMQESVNSLLLAAAEACRDEAPTQHLKGLAKLGNYKQLDAAVAKWLSSSYWYRHVDEWPLESLDFETELASTLTSIREGTIQSFDSRLREVKLDQGEVLFQNTAT